MTGLPPSVHGSSHPAHPWLRPDLSTLAQDLAAAGFATGAFYGNPWSGPEFGLERGFETSRPLLRRAAERWLAAPPAGPSFTWVELPSPGSSSAVTAAGDERDEIETAGTHAAARQENAAARQADAALRQEDPAAAYRSRLADADRRFGRLLDALRRSGRYDEAIVMVLADHGEAFAAGGAVPPGRDLGRASVEVPLAIRVPEALRAAPRRAGGSHGRPRPPAGDDARAGGPAAGARPGAQSAAARRLGGALRAVVGERLPRGRRSTRTAISCAGAAASRPPTRTSTPPGAKRWAPTAGSPTATRCTPRGRVSGRDPVARRERTSCSRRGHPVLRQCAVDDDVRRDRMIERLRHLRRFPPAFLSEPAPAPPLLRRREFFSLAGWGLPLPRQWWSATARDGVLGLKRPGPPAGRARAGGARKRYSPRAASFAAM